MTPERNVLLWLLEVTLIISAPISWWRQADQYNIQIFPMRRNPDSDDRFLTSDDFEGPVSREKVAVLNNYIRDGQSDTAIALLPANFIQRGLAKASYRTLKDIRAAAAGTREEHWQVFLTFLQTLPYYELIAPSQ